MTVSSLPLKVLSSWRTATASTTSDLRKITDNLYDDRFLFSEVKNFRRICSVLCAHTKPNHKEDAAETRHAYAAAIEALWFRARAVLFKRDENHDAQTREEQMLWQHNWKILKDSYRMWQREPLGSNAYTRGTAFRKREDWEEEKRVRRDRARARAANGMSK